MNAIDRDSLLKHVDIEIENAKFLGDKHAEQIWTNFKWEIQSGAFDLRTEPQELKPGELVYYEKWGAGVVLSVYGPTARVKFNNGVDMVSINQLIKVEDDGHDD